MAWYDRYNGSTQPNQPASKQPAVISPWASKINQTIQVASKLNVKPGLAFQTAEARKNTVSAFPKTLPYKASVGSVYKDPATKRLYQFTQGGWKEQTKNPEFPPASIVKDPSKLEAVGGTAVKILAALQEKVGETINRAKDPAKRPGLIKDVKEGAKNLAVDVARSIPRSGATLALTYGGQKEFTPGAERGQGETKKKIEKFLYGDEKIKDVRGSGEDTVLAFGGNQDTAKKYGLPAGIALAALDFIPGTPGKKKLAETIAKEGGETVIKNLLKKNVKGISEETATALGKHFAPINDIKAVENQLQYLTKVDRTQLTGQALKASNEEILEGRAKSMGFGGNKVFQPVNPGEDKGFDFLNRNYDHLKERYKAENKNKLLNADDVRELFKPVGYNRINSKDYHEASSALAKEIFKEDVARLKPGDRYLFTAGSSGAGKSKALEAYPTIQDGIAGGLDGNFSSNSSLSKLDDVLKTGADTGLAFVHRNPENAWTDGVVKRALDPKNGRVVPLETFIDNLIGSKAKVLEAVEKYGDQVKLMVIDNNYGPGGAKYINEGVPFLQKIVYNKDDVREQLIKATVDKIKDGTIKSEETAKALLGRNWEVANEQLEQAGFKGFSGAGLADDVVTDASNFAAKLPKEEYAKLTPRPPKPPSDSIVEEVKAGFDAGRKAREEVEKGARGTIGQRFRTETVDRLTPVFDFINKAGKNLPTEQNPYRKMRLLAGVGGKVEAFMMNKISPVLKKESKRLDDLSVLWTLERERELVERGLTRKRNAGEIAQGVAELKAKYGDEGFATLQESSNELRKVGSEMLESLNKAGIISDESFDAIKAKNQFYAPMEAVEHIADNLEKGNFGTGNSFNVASQDIIKGIKSYEGDVGDPIEAMVRQIPKVMALVEKNQAVKSLVDMRNEFPNTFSKLIMPAGETLPKGFGAVNVFEGGKNVRYAVPEAVEGAVKNLDAETAGILVKVGSIQAKILRAGATGLNIGFIPVNIIRDVQDALTTELTERGAIAMARFIASYPQAIMSAAGKGKLWKEWASSGGLSSTLTEQVFKQTPKTVGELAGKKNIIKMALSSPKDLVEFANRVGEQSTRLARYKSGLSRGETPAEAAFKSRDISLDFAKAGNKIKVLNQVIPFLNAGIQGSEKLLRLYKDNPIAAIASTGVMFGVPAVALYNYNSQFKDFDDIPDSERQDNWIIIARDRTEEEKAAGEKVIGIKVPKGFLGKMTTNAVDGAMDFMRKKDPSTFLSAGLDAVAGISPVGIPYNKEKLGQSLSGILPPWIQAGLEATTNTNLYFNQPIVPKKLEDVEASEQYKENTPEIYKKAGKVTGISPLILENTANTTTGGLGRQAAELASGKVKEGTVDQVTRRFSGIKSGEEVNTEFDEVAKFATEAKTISLEKQREAEKLLEEYKALPADEANRRAGELKNTDPALFEKLKSTVESDKLGLTSLERFVKTLPVEDGSRAKYILQNVNKLETAEEKNNYISDLKEKKIASDLVIKQLRYLISQPAN